MKTNALIPWPEMFPHPGLTTKFLRKRQGVVKRLSLPAHPDQDTIRKLNDLAAKKPFCIVHRVKKHDML